MVTATFQPSNAGAQLQQQALGMAEGFQNLFARAEAMKQSRERLDMEKQRFAREASMAALDTKAKELQIKQLNNQLEIQDKTRDTEIRVSDAKKKQAEQEISTMEAEENLFASLPTALRGVADIKEDDYDGLLNAYTSFQRVYGHLGSGKHAARFAAVAGPQLETLTGRLASSQMLLERYAQNAIPQLQLALLADDDGASLQKIVADPAVQRAAFSGGEAGKALQQTWQEGVKALMDRKTKVAEKKAAEEVALNKEGRKNDRELSAPGWEGNARTREEGVKFREADGNVNQIVEVLDNAIKIAEEYQAESDPVKKAEKYVLAKQAADMVVGKLRLPLTGPGAFTDSEREFVKDTIGNPTKIVALSSIEFAKIRAMKSALTSGIEIQAKSYGYTGRAAKPAADTTGDGQTFSGSINGKQVEGKWVTDGKGRKGVFGNDGNFYPVTP